MIKRKIRRLKIVLTDTRWWPFYIQRQFLKSPIRDLLAGLVAKFRPQRDIKTSCDVNVVNIHSQEINETGISHLGQIFTSEQCKEICKYFEDKLVFDDYRPETPPFLPMSDRRNPLSHIAHHNARDILLAPYLFDLANTPEILKVAEKFLGCKPTIGYMAAWWSYPTSLGAQQAEFFHRDVDDWRFLKLFVYLTDVGIENGPHIYVTKSATNNHLREIRRFDDEEIAKEFGSNNILTLTGNAGEGFFENTFGMHKGQPVAKGRRLIFQVVYSMFPLPYGPARPVLKKADLDGVRRGDIDSWTNRIYLYND